MKTPIQTPTSRTRKRYQLICEEDSRCKQSFKDECNINNIIKRHHATGIPLPTHETVGAKFGDFTGIPDYHTAMGKVTKAREAFLNLPSAIRRVFNNDPGQFIEFATNPENSRELIEMGLANAPDPSLVDELAEAIKINRPEPKTTTTTGTKPD